MRSRLYECRMAHARFAPKPHAFAYRIFLFALDLDEVPALSQRLRLFSAGRRNLYSFREGDYLPLYEPVHAGTPIAGAGGGLKARVLAQLAAPGLDLTG
ncbi:MAG: DUF1365 family protein, partial [Cephaloticoccus sp.]